MARSALFIPIFGTHLPEVLPPGRHIIGKAHTIDIEHDNSNTRHHLGRFTRRTKIVSQKDSKVDLTLKIWQALADDSVFKAFQTVAMRIYT